MALAKRKFHLHHQNNIVRFRPRNASKKPKTFTEAERMMEYISQRIMADPRTFAQIAQEVGVSAGTILNLARGTTKWPRPKTLFPVLKYLGVELSIVDKGNNTS